HFRPQRKRKREEAAKARRHTILVCLTGVSIGMNVTPFPVSHSRNVRFGPISGSSAPHAIHNNRRRALSFESTVGKVASKSSSIPPALNDPIQPNVFAAFKPI